MRKGKNRSSSKTVPDTALTGQKGVHIIEGIVLQMGCVWRPQQSLDVGIDGYIELRNASSGEMSGKHIAVQSKCGESYIHAEKEDEFAFTPDERDLGYWSRANLPVLVVISRDSSGDAYCFWSDEATTRRHANSRAIRISKTVDAFTPDKLRELNRKTAKQGVGFYLSLPQERETYYTNLLEVKRLPDHVYLAVPKNKDHEATLEGLRELDVAEGREIVVRGDYLLGCHDLSDAAWSSIVEPGTTEQYDLSEWAESDDPETQRRFVDLLNRMLSVLISRSDLRYWKEGRYYYFRKPLHSNVRKMPYKRGGRQSELTVVKGDTKTFGDRQFHSFRHLALRIGWRRLGATWYAVLNPTWHYTRDGEEQDPRHEEWLSGMRRMEQNNSLTSQVIMFADYLKDRGGLLSERHSTFGFGDLRTEEAHAVVPDQEWSGLKEPLSVDPNASPEDEDFEDDLFGYEEEAWE